MAEGIEPIASWTFMREIDLPSDISSILIDGEQPFAAYATVRDAAVFTNKRLIIRDSQGITGKKIEMYSLPWSSINMWSSENAGFMDINSEIELWTRAGHIKNALKQGVDIRKIDQLISYFVLS